MKKTNYINQISILFFTLCSIAASATGISPRSIDPIHGLPTIEVISLKDNNAASDDIIKFEAKFADSIDDAACRGCTYDIEFAGNVKHEYKSYAKASLGILKAKILNGGTSGFYNQFKAYLQDGNFKYNFNVQPEVKLDNLDDARKFFRDVIAGKAEELWEVGGPYFNSIDPSITSAAKLKTAMSQGPISLNHKILKFIQ